MSSSLARGNAVSYQGAQLRQSSSNILRFVDIDDIDVAAAGGQPGQARRPANLYIGGPGLWPLTIMALAFPRIGRSSGLEPGGGGPRVRGARPPPPTGRSHRCGPARPAQGIRVRFRDYHNQLEI